MLYDFIVSGFSLQKHGHCLESQSLPVAFHVRFVRQAIPDGVDMGAVGASLLRSLSALALGPPHPHAAVCGAGGCHVVGSHLQLASHHLHCCCSSAYALTLRDDTCSRYTKHYVQHMDNADSCHLVITIC